LLCQEVHKRKSKIVRPQHELKKKYEMLSEREERRSAKNSPSMSPVGLCGQPDTADLAKRSEETLHIALGGFESEIAHDELRAARLDLCPLR
jgi:hypothetical protein